MSWSRCQVLLVVVDHSLSSRESTIGASSRCPAIDRLLRLRCHLAIDFLSDASYPCFGLAFVLNHGRDHCHGCPSQAFGSSACSLKRDLFICPWILLCILTTPRLSPSRCTPQVGSGHVSRGRRVVTGSLFHYYHYSSDPFPTLTLSLTLAWRTSRDPSRIPVCGGSWECLEGCLFFLGLQGFY